MRTCVRLTGLLLNLTLLLALLAVPGTARACHHGGSTALSATPEAGTAGTPFTITGAGFDAGGDVTVEVFDGSRELVDIRPVRVDEEGGFVVTVDSAGYSPGTYAVVVTTSAGSQVGAVFTVTAAADGVAVGALDSRVP